MFNIQFWYTKIMLLLLLLVGDVFCVDIVSLEMEMHLISVFSLLVISVSMIYIVDKRPAWPVVRQ